MGNTEMCLFCQTGFVASSAAEGRAEGWSTMAWALVPWNAKELMPVTDGADGAGATCLGNSRPRPAALLLNVASRCGFNCISNAYFVEYLVMQNAVPSFCMQAFSSIEHDCCQAAIVSYACGVCQPNMFMGDGTVQNSMMWFTEQQSSAS